MQPRIHFSRYGIILLLVFLTLPCSAQLFITYPSPAQGLTRQLDSSTLTVKVAFSGACSNAMVNIRFPAGVVYMPGSVTKTAGSTSLAITATGSSLTSPTFSITGVNGVSDITFTLRRRALCNAPAGGKDTVVVTGDCGIQSENSATVNTYAVTAPSLTIPSVASLSNVANNTVFTRNISVINGGSACLDTLYFFICYPQAGIQLQSLRANGNLITSYRSNGDSLFFKVSGPLLGTNGLLCNAGTVSFTETGTIKRCNTNTTFGARWGHADNAAACQTVTVQGNMTMSAIHQGVSVTAITSQAISTCTPGIYDFVFNSNGSGTGNAGALFDLVACLNTNTTIDSIKIFNGATYMPVTFTVSGSICNVNAAQFTSDPDGATGLADLDGDGLFDELPSGNSLRLRAYLRWPCPGIGLNVFPSVTYNNMCGTDGTGSGNNQFGGSPFNYIISGTYRNALCPSDVISGAPFNITVINGGSFVLPAGPTDSTYLRLLLPAGVSLAGSGNITLNGTVVPASRTRVLAGISPAPDTLIIASKGRVTGTYSLNVVYNGPSATLNFSYDTRYISDQSCNCSINMFNLAPFSINARDNNGGNCPLGISNLAPKVSRRTLGYTDNTLTTKVSASGLSGISAITMLVRDSMTIEQAGIQHGSGNNIFYSYSVGKAGVSNVLSFAHGIFNVKNQATGAISSCAMPAPADSGNATTQRMVWNLSNCLPGGQMNQGDSVWVTVWYAVNAAYGNTRTAAPGTASFFFCKDSPADTNIICNVFPTHFYLTAYSIYTQPNGANPTNCNPVSIGGGGDLRYGTGENLDIYPNEYRPALIIDSFAYVLLPNGYVFNPAMPANATYSGSGIPTVSSPFTISGNRAVARSGAAGSATYWRPTDLQFVTGFGNTLVTGVQIQPTCQASATAANGVATYYYRSFAYSDNPGTGLVNINYPSSWPAANRPLLTILNNTGNVQGVLRQHSWDLQINNTGGSTAANTWLSLRKGDTASGIIVDSVNLLSAGNVLGARLIQLSYAQGTWYQISTAGIPAGNGSQSLRVFFHYTRCSNDSLIAGVGWNCTGYPTDPTTYPCTVSQTVLKVQPSGSEIQFAISNQPTQPISLCSIDSMVLTLNSAQAANITNPSVSISPPAGMSLISPFEVEYPLNSGAWEPVQALFTNGHYNIDLSQHPGLGINGLPGTLTSAGAADRQARLKFRFSNDCSFASGDIVNFQVSGKRPCGAPAPGDGAQQRSNPVHIIGAPPLINNVATDITIAAAAIDCSNGTRVNLTVTPVGAEMGPADTAIHILPKGMAYAPGSFVAGANCNGCTLYAATQPDGQTRLKVNLPAGSAANTPVHFDYDIMARGATCGSDSIRCTVERSVIPPLSCGAVVCSSSKMIIGSAFSEAIAINKPDLVLSAAQRISGNWITGQQGAAAFTYTNNGTLAAPANTYHAEFFIGTDSIPFQTSTLSKAVAIGASQRDTVTLNFPDSASGPDVAVKVRPSMANNMVQCLCAEQMTIFSTPLPLKLQTFTVREEACMAHLSWTSSEERNAAHFELQYSSDGQSFEPVAQQPCRYTRGGNYTYVYPVRDPKSFFRLSMIDRDGQSTLSTVLTLVSDCVTEMPQLRPNPTSGQLTISGLEKADKIQLYSLEGKLIQQFTARERTEHLDIHSFTPGLYLLKVWGHKGQLKQVFKVTKL